MLFSLPLVFAALMTGWSRSLALSRGWMDIPNARSSHTEPTARGAGLAIAIVLIVTAILLSRDSGRPSILAVGALGGVCVSVIGWLDDIRSVPAKYRFIVHALTATTFVATVLNEPATSQFLPGAPQLGMGVLLTLGVIWSINLFNFMDGIDGIAASQALFVSGASALLASFHPEQSMWTMLSFATAGSSLGFLLWNWPPAKVFMGDVGSGFLGYWLAVTAIGLHIFDDVPIWTSVTLGSVFIADSTVTLIRRLFRGEKWYQAHRSHAYQILARRWSSHLRVTSLLWVTNIIVVLPLAWLSHTREAASIWIALGLIIVLSVACALIGAGKAADAP